jgi:hypothetical protein
MYNSSGQQQWAVRYNGPNNTSDDASSVTADAAGSVYVTGASNSGGTNLDYLTIKYSSSGSLLWEQRYNGQGNGVDAALSICLDNSGNVSVTGNSLGIGSSSDYATIRYSVTTGIEPVSTEIPDKFMLYNNYPNPFNPVTKIKFDTPNSAYTNIVIYDVTGREIKTLINQNISAGRYEIEFDASGLSSGVYFYRINAGDFKDVKRMALVK